MRRSRNKTSVTDMVDVKYLHLYFVLWQRTSSKCDQPIFRMTPHHVHIYMTVSVCNRNSRDKFPHLSKRHSSYKQLFDCSFRNEKFTERVRSTFARSGCLSFRSADSHNSWSCLVQLRAIGTCHIWLLVPNTNRHCTLRVWVHMEHNLTKYHVIKK